MTNFIGRVIRTASLGALGCGALLGAAGCEKHDEAAAARPPALVNVVPAIAQDVPVYLDEIGKINAFETVTIMPQVSGRLEAIHFVDGADVKKDKQLLATIDARPFVAALNQAKAQQAKDEATATNAERFFKKEAEVYAQKFISDSDYDTARYNAESARAAVEADKAAVASALLNVEYCTIKSPIDGRAGMHQVDPNNMVKINETALVMIERLDPIFADFTINERDLPAVRAHMADHTLKALVRLPTEQDADAAAASDVTFLDNAVLDASGTIRLRATVPNKDRQFWPGQFVNVRLIKTVSAQAVLVPLNAPQIGQQGAYVYVVKDSKAEQRTVVLGQQHDVGADPNKETFVVVTKGIAAGEQVVVNGQLMLFPGAPVKIEAVKKREGDSPATKPAESDPDATVLNTQSLQADGGQR